MNRISLVAAAALLLVNSATIPAQTLPANDPAWSRAVNLMPLIDPEKDAVTGVWTLQDGKLLSDRHRHARIQIPYEPPEQYDYRIVFARLEGNSAVTQIFSQAGRAASWMMGNYNNTAFSFEKVLRKQDSTVAHAQSCLENGKLHTSVLRVRTNGVTAFLDGKRICHWSTDFSDASQHPIWVLPDSRCLGVGSYLSPSAFHKIELLEITGKGRVVPHGEKAVAKTESEKPQPQRVGGIADQEMQKDARKLTRNQSIIKALYVVRTSAGLRVGGAQDIIATAQRVSGNRETICDIVTDVAKDTQISMEEAERLLKVRYPVWQAGYKIRFSYSNKYTKQAGGSAGGAFSVLLLSLLDDMQIDPGFGMTGDVTVDGKIREVGAVPEKLRGALLDKCRIIAIPEANKENLNDLVLLYSPSMLWNMQILSITTLNDAATVARVDRPEKLAKAMELFVQVQRSLGANATAYALRNAGIIQTLQQVLQLAPNHLSAEFMLRANAGQLPNTLSLGGSLEEIWAAAGPLLSFLFADYKEPSKSKRYYFDKVPSAAFKAAMERLNWLQYRLHPKTRELKATLAEYMTSLDQLHRASTFSSATLKQHLAKRDKVLSEAHLLGTDRKTLEEMMH